ncbi:hypothetical protein [Fluviicola sp.]|uniref:hypothetical protein n=1 Tax=Fluviicola sp. TaxID=1917219 RepID=UPI0031E22A07
MNREDIKKHFESNGYTGWHTLIDIVYDRKPDHIEIKEVFEKYAWLEVRYNGEDEDYKYLLQAIKTISECMCQVCGESGGHSLIDGWETTLCDKHFESADAALKLRG